MDDISILTRSDISTESKVGTIYKRNEFSSENPTVSPDIDNLIAEGGEYFFHYLRWLGLANDPNFLVLSSRHHYFYDSSELKGVRTLINLKRLNLTKNLDTFLHSVCHCLSPKSNFIGCFSERKVQNMKGLPSRMYKGFINFLDSRTDKELDRNEVSGLLQTNGFKIVDMKEMNGLIYFYSQNVNRPASLI